MANLLKGFVKGVVAPVKGKVEDAANGMMTAGAKKEDAPKDAKNSDAMDMPAQGKAGGNSYQMNEASYSSNRAVAMENGVIQNKAQDVEKSDKAAEGKAPDGNDYENTKYVSISENGIETAPKAKASFSSLVKQDDKGSIIDTLNGTLSAPNVKNELKPETMYIDNTPIADDIRQCNIGDCYFLAALLHVVQNDPQRIRNMNVLNGQQVTTTFYHKEGLFGNKWVETQVTTRLGELERTSGDEPDVYGAYYRVAFNPKTSKWYANIDSSTLKFTRRDYFEAALWVTAMEHAFEVFAQKHGRYGRGHNIFESKDFVKNITGGFEQKMFGIFYGSRAGANEDMATKLPNKDQSVLEANQKVIERLWKFEQSQNGAYEKDVFMSGFNNDGDNYSRLKTFGEQVKQDLESMEDSKEALDAYKTLMDAAKAVKKSDSDQDKAALNAAMNAFFACESVSNIPQDKQTLFRNAVANMSQTASNRYIYSSHAYNISEVKLVDSEGNAIDAKDVKELISRIDADKSYVTMQNPWGTGTPNIAGDDKKNNQANAGEYVGSFSTPLGEYLQSVNHVSYAEIDRK